MRGATLRARRLALGRSIDSVAAATRIPLEHVEALEDERLDDLPAGPYAAAYTRQIVEHLGIDGSSEEAAPPRAEPPHGAPLWLVRAMAAASLVLLVAVLSSAVYDRVRTRIPAPVVLDVPDQNVVVVARQTTRIGVVVDGVATAERVLPGGERVELDGRDRIELTLQATGDVHLEWNGTTIVPQGRQDSPRKIVFVDDRGAW